MYSHKKLIGNYPVLAETRIRKLFSIYQAERESFSYWSSQDPDRPKSLANCLNPHKLPKKLTKRQKIALQAREKIILHNIGLVTRIVDRYKRNPEVHEDLAQSGMTGLAKAVDTFDLDRNVMFSTYATWKILQQIYIASLDHLRSIRLDGNTIERVRVITKAREVCLKEFGTATVRQVSEKINTTRFIPIEETMKDVQRIMLDTRNPRSITAMANGDETYELPIANPIKHKCYSLDQIESMRDYLNSLLPDSDKYVQIMELAMGLNGYNLSVDEIAQELGMEAQDVEGYITTAVDVVNANRYFTNSSYASF